jgi:exodeoxyribonuclease VIII
MIDLETWGARSGCAIGAIGAVFFDKGQLLEEFYVRVDLASCLEAGLKLDHSTVLWWMQQSDAARAQMCDPKLSRQPLGAALGQLSDFLIMTCIADTKGPGEDNLRVWGNGASFDNPILVAAYEAAGMHAPWRFWNDRCYRTMKSQAPHVKMPRTGTHHNAIDDAKSQALHLMEISSALDLPLK